MKARRSTVACRRQVRRPSCETQGFRQLVYFRGELSIRTRVILTSSILLSAVLFLGACNRRGTTDDKAITERIQSKLYRDSTLKTRDISVISQNGVVVLSGQVNSGDEKAAAEHLATAEGGVKQVINQLAVVGTSAAVPEPSKGPAASGPPASADQAAPIPPPPPKPAVVTLPAGTVVAVQMIDSINSKTSQPGSEFKATLAVPLVLGEQVVFTQGSDASVRLVAAKQAGRVKGSSELQVQLVSLARKGKTYPLQTDFLQAKGDSRGKQTGKRMAGGALIGGVIGGIAGGRKGVAIGAGAGAGSAALVQAVTKGKEVKVPSETKLDFKLSAPLEIDL